MSGAPANPKNALRALIEFGSFLLDVHDKIVDGHHPIDAAAEAFRGSGVERRSRAIGFQAPAVVSVKVTPATAPKSKNQETKPSPFVSPFTPGDKHPFCLHGRIWKKCDKGCKRKEDDSP
jgi:hypothetical protein